MVRVSLVLLAGCCCLPVSGQSAKNDTAKVTIKDND